MFKKIPLAATLIGTLGLGSCSPQRAPIVGEASLAATSAPVSGNHRFDLFKLEPNGQVGVWKKVKNLQQPKGINKITIVMHGFALGDRSIAEEPTKITVADKFGLVDFSEKTRKHRFAPASRNAGDIYALMWDSRAGNPWELENLLMGGTWAPPWEVNRRKTEEVKEYLSSDIIDSEQDTDFFTELYSFYSAIGSNLAGTKMNLAGFSKGGHVAIKLATKHNMLSRSQLQSLSLLDVYVGPTWSNGGLGGKLINNIRSIKQSNRDLKIVNYRTSNIYDLKLGTLPLADVSFINQLKAETNEVWIFPNAVEQAKNKSSPSLSKIQPIAKIFQDHFRAPQYFLLSSLLCDPTKPSIIWPELPSNSLSFVTPEFVTDWIYSGPVMEP